MIPWLDPNHPPYFPESSSALDEPNGLLAAGGLLNTKWLVLAYQRGIFPWFSEGQPILWWTPTPRTILLPNNFHASKSLKKLIRQQKFRLSQNHCFADVIQHCAAPRQDQPDTWIVEPMIDAYIALHKAGLACSVECWSGDNELIGGLYGVSLGRVFFGESMFSRVSNASKLCLHHLLASQQYDVIDCQMESEHLASLGAITIERSEFESMIKFRCQG